MNRGINPNLTPLEIVMLRYMADGKQRKEIAVLVARSPNTIRNHEVQINLKLNAMNKAHAVAIGLRRGIIK